MFVPYVLILLQIDDTILLLQRDNVSFGKGFYCLPGGKIEPNETARQAAIREAYEEVGVKIQADDLEFCHIFHRKGVTEEIFALVFKATKWDGKCFNKEPEKHSNLQWFAFNALPEKLFPVHMQAIKYLREKITYSEHGWSQT